jgi:PilZ domain-containing protein
MQLSSEHFERIVLALRSDGSNGNGREKRRQPRVGLRAAVTVVEHAQRAKSLRTTSILRDVSREGLGIQHCREIKIGERFLVQFPSVGGALQSYLCTARRCQPVTKDSLEAFHIGATFVRVCNFGSKSDGNSVPSAAINSESFASKKELADSARLRKAILE